MMWRMALGAALVAALGIGVGLYGAKRYKAGFAAAQAAHEADRMAVQRRLFEAGEQISNLAAALEVSRAEQQVLAERLEDEARIDPDGKRAGIGADGVRRLRERWGSR